MTVKTFVENQKPSGLLSNYFVWSLPVNWSPAGIPDAGDDAVVSAEVANDHQVDDIPNLNLNSLMLAATAAFAETLYVDTKLTIGTLTLAGVGGNAPLLEATNTGGATPTLTIGSFAPGAAGTLLSYGLGSAIYDNAATDPGGLIYQVANGGLIDFASSLAATSRLQFLDNLSDTLAFADPGATIGATLTGLGSGDAIELPGSTVLSLNFGASSLSVQTDQGSYTFNHVLYAGAAPTSYYGEKDPATGLEKIIFGGPDFFSANSAVYAGEYLWSDPKNWSDSVVANSGVVEIDEPNGLDFYSYVIDVPVHLARFNLNELVLPTLHPIPLQVYIVADSTFDTVYTGVHPVWITVNPYQSGISSATLTLNGSLQFSQIFQDETQADIIEATGPGARVNVSATEAAPGPIVAFEAFDGGTIDFSGSLASNWEIVADATPGNLVELANPGASIGNVVELAPNLALELPGTRLVAATIGAKTLTVQTDLGNYSFTNIAKYSTVWGLKSAYDSASGLEKLTFSATANVIAVTASGLGISSGSGAVNSTVVVTLTVSMSAAVTVGNLGSSPPALRLNDGGVAVYLAGSGTSSLTFAYSVTSGDNVAALAVTSFQNNGATFSDPGGLPADMSGVVGSLTGTVEVDTTAPSLSVVSGASFSSIAANGALIEYTGLVSDNFVVTRVSLYDHLTRIGDATLDGSGRWTFMALLASGDHTGLHLTAYDAAGNNSTPLFPSGEVEVLTGSTISFGANRSLTLVGNDDNVTLAANDSLSLWGSDDTINASSASITLNNAQTVLVGDDDVINFAVVGSSLRLQTLATSAVETISGFQSSDSIAIEGLTANYLTAGPQGGTPTSFKLYVAGNVVTQANADGSKLSSHFNIAGQNYTTVVRSFDAAGDLIAVEHEGITGSPYISDATLYSGPGTTGNIVSGNDLFYTNQSSGLTEVDLDGSGNLTRALYAYATTTPGTQTGFEADYVAGQLAGGFATYMAPAGATYSTFAVEYDSNFQYVGAVYTFNYTGQTYDEAQYSYTAAAQPKLTEATFSGYTGSGGPSVASFFYDSSGASTGVQYSYEGITGQAYTSDTLLFNSSNVLIAAQYSGYTTKPFSSQTTFYNASGVAQEILRDFTGPASAGSINGQAYNAYEKILNPAFTLLATAYHLDNGGNVYVGVASNVASPIFGGSGVTPNTAELSNALYGGDWTITGGGTGETFNFAAFFNKAEITDYGAAFGGATDVVSVSTQDFADWTTMLADAASSGGGSNTTFTSTTTGDKLTLDGVTLSQLRLLTTNQASADFLFHA